MVTHAVRLRSKGQITIPIEVREDLGLEEGDVLYLQKLEGKYVVTSANDWVAETAGIFAEYAKNGPTDLERDEIWEGISKERSKRLIAEDEDTYDPR